MAELRPIVRLPEGWTYGENSEYDFGRWVTTYTVTHGCGVVKSETARPVGDDFREAGKVLDGCANGLAFFIGNHRCTTEGTDGK